MFRIREFIEVDVKARIIVFIIICLKYEFATSGRIEIHNDDSRSHVVALDCKGDRKFIVVSKLTTSLYIFHAKENKCNIVGGTVGFYEPVLIDGESWKFKNSLAQRN